MSNLAAMLRLPANLKSTQWQILAGPILILLILSMMVLPLPAFILDLLFTFNIALSIMGSQSRCVELEGQSGTTVAFSGIAAAEPLRFIWEVPGGGRLIPPLKVQRNEVIVNYR